MTKIDIYTDIDEVWFNWYRGFFMWMAKHQDMHPLSDSPNTYNLFGEGSQGYPSLERTEGLKLIQQYNDSPDADQVPEYPGAVEAVQFLLTIANVKAITSNSPRRADVIRRRLGIQDVTVVPLGATKLDVLKNLKSGLWIEDNIQNAQHGVEAGHMVILMDREHNRELDVPTLRTWGSNPGPIIRCFSFSEILVVVGAYERGEMKR